MVPQKPAISSPVKYSRKYDAVWLTRLQNHVEFEIDFKIAGFSKNYDKELESSAAD